MLLNIEHVTRYSYDTPVSYALQKVRLCPLNGPLQTIKDWSVSVEGGVTELSYLDHYGNHTDLVNAEAGVTEIAISAKGTVETTDNGGVLGKTYGTAPLWHFLTPTPLTEIGKNVRALSKMITNPDDALDALHALSASILSATPYQLGVTDAKSTAEEALAVAGGVCQDHAHIFIAACRQAGVPARYVSGYLMMNESVNQDASHAWAEAHLPLLGWVGFDISNGYSPDDRYVRLAIGRDASDAAPVSGIRRGSGDESMIVSLSVQQ